jgi:deazaflavin-dependent oxidoreductase (nitroreductase family)
MRSGTLEPRHPRPDSSRTPPGILVPVSLAADIFARISPHLAHRPGSARATQLHAWLVRHTGGRIGGRAIGADILVLRTVGRRSGRVRDAPLLFAPFGDGFAIVASNAASEHPPAWWFNLQDTPDADAVVHGRMHPVRARPATAEEIAELWPRLVEIYSGYEHYRSIAARELPVVILEPR